MLLKLRCYMKHAEQGLSQSEQNTGILRKIRAAAVYNFGRQSKPISHQCAHRVPGSREPNAHQHNLLNFRASIGSSLMFSNHQVVRI